MFTKSTAYYDAIYAAQGKDYTREAQQIDALIHKHKQSEGKALLDVACGTGGHIAFLRQFYDIKGVDLDANMLEIARQRFPNLRFHRADMTDFDLERTFDVVICLFSSIGYTKTAERLQQAVQTMSRHLRPGGLLIIEPWLTPEKYQEGRVSAVFVDQPELKIARMNTSNRKDRISVFNFHYLVATPAGVEHFTEKHELGLFTHDDYMTAFQECGMNVIYDPEGLTDRGLYIGLQPVSPES